MQIPKEQAKKQISQLIERFDDHIDEYKRGSYNETQTRVDYINPFFKALGWDIDNEQGLAEAYREVIHEDKIKIGKTTKAPDYCFTVYGQRKFFVDAKKPSINIKNDISPAYQVRRYGWSAKLSIAIVTDFEEFSIYDCSKKPNQNDRSSVARIQYLTYKDYLKEFDFIWETFSKERILKGSFDNYVQSDTKKRGTATVDNEFLKEIDEWRKYLATTIALRNATLSEDEINYAVQKTVDRIIFLRICEDRGVEQYGNLNNAIKKGDLYKNLFELFHIADEKYNSGLFDFKEDNITPNLIIDNKVIKNIIRELYYPHSPFEFSVLPADILGSVYEQFLGKTIRLTKAHQAKIEEKPEVRKAGGVYYTPKYIVNYIVENTVGKLLNGKTPKQAEKIRICDPACGSGSFLIGAYQYLLDWHLKYYIDNPPKKKKEGPVTPDGNLTTAEKKRILLNNIYGVDIDPQAAEVTKLNLLLKALEGETQASISKQLSFFNERVLPNLGDNIKCGNSLISTDFYDNQLDLFPNQIKKINAFDWEETFSDIFANGGFDAVIGNPPYVFTRGNKQLQKFNQYIWQTFNHNKGKLNFFSVFLELSLDRILKDGGRIGFITPETFIRTSTYGEIRKYIIERYNINKIVVYGIGVFENVTAETVVLIIEKKFDKRNIVKFEKAISQSEAITYEEKQVGFLGTPENRLAYGISKKEKKIFEKIKSNNLFLGEIVVVRNGIATKAGKKNFISNKKESDKYKKLLEAPDLKRYAFSWPGTYINYDRDLLHRPRKEETFLSEKIMIQRVSPRLICCYDDEQYYTFNSVNNLILQNPNYSLKYILGILNSKLIDVFYRKNYSLDASYTITVTKQNLDSIPIPKYKNQKQIISLVDNLLKLNKQLQKTKLDNQQQQIQRAITHAEKKIDTLVYQLYKLTKEEIEIIEQST